jgi:hypothetical protein
MSFTRRRLVLAVAVPVVLALVLVGFLVAGRGSDDHGGQRSATGASGATVPVTQPTPSPPATTAAPTGPTVANGDADPQAAFGGIVKTFNWLSWHPRGTPDLLGLIYDPRCPCFARVLADQRRLVTRGWRYADQDKGLQVVSLRVFSRRGRDTVTLAVVDQQGKQIIVDKTGKVVETGNGWPPTPRLYTLRRGGDGRWRVTGILTGG